jgi:xanthine dehydrogenase small subunit
MRDHLVLYINGARQVVRGRDALLSLSDFLRRRLGLIGTKIVCSEGDCGACTVLVGRPPKAKVERGNGKAETPGDSRSPFVFPLSTFNYLPVDSCIQFMFQLDGAHVVTVEGLRPDRGLNAVQQAMVDCHGSQCGFCTPGFVMAMTGLLEESNGDSFDEHAWRRGLTGNLCRCTGYTPILNAAQQACGVGDHEHLNDLYLAAPMLADLEELAADPIEIEAPAPLGSTSPTQRVACPATLADALAFLATNPGVRIIAGATDVGVRANKSGRLPDTILDLNRVAELDFVRVAGSELTAGARANWTALLTACESACPEFARILSVFGAPQIRHVGTIGGNIANASPIADSLPLLYVMDAILTLASAAGRREVNINDFYHGYKQFDLRPDELIAEVQIPLPASDEHLRLYKISRRRDLDISTFTAAIRMRLSDDRIERTAIALGGVGPTVLRARCTEQFLAGQQLSEEVMLAAGDLAASEITPITDVRGAADYRRQLTRNIFLKFYHESQTNLATA